MSGRIWNSDKKYSQIQRECDNVGSESIETETEVIDAFEFLYF